MQHNRGSRFQSIMSVQSRKSNISFSKSLGRPSWQLKDPSIDRKASLIYAMSIQSDTRKSDIFQRLLQSQKKPLNRASNATGGNFYIENNPFYNNNTLNQRNSDAIINNQTEIQIDHECGCFEECFQQMCPCFQAKNQMCIKGTCCKNCVQLKIKLLRGNKLNSQQNYNFVSENNQHHLSDYYSFYSENGNHLYQEPYHEVHQVNQVVQEIDNVLNIQSQTQQNQILVCNCKNTQCLKSYCKCFQSGQFCSQKCGCQSCKNKFDSQQRNIARQAIKFNNQIIFCTCKKTKCNKKYCSCYAAGIKCGKQCSCQNCQNHDSQNDMDIEVYEGEQQQDYKNMQMPQRMSFQRPNFQ